MYVYGYNHTDCLWVVGFFAPDGKWNPESEWVTKEEAASRVHWLNGGQALKEAS